MANAKICVRRRMGLMFCFRLLVFMASPVVSLTCTLNLYSTINTASLGMAVCILFIATISFTVKKFFDLKMSDCFKKKK